MKRNKIAGFQPSRITCFYKASNIVFLLSLCSYQNQIEKPTEKAAFDKEEQEIKMPGWFTLFHNH